MIDNIAKALKGVDLLGCLVTWELHTGSGVPRAALRTSAKAAGCDDLKVNDAWPEGTFRRTLRSVRAIDNNLSAKILRDDDGALVFAVVDTSVNEAAQVGDQAGNVITRALWRKTPAKGEEQFSFDPDGSPELATALSDRYHWLIEHLTADELRETIYRTIKKWKGVRIHGRLYFVDSKHLDAVAKLKAALAQSGSSVYVIPVPDVAESREAVAAGVRKQVLVELKRLREEVSRWNQGARNPRQSTIKDRLETYQALRADLDLMAEVLNLKSDDLRRDLSDMEQVAKSMLGLPATPAEKAPEPAAAAPPPAAAPTEPEPPAKPVVPGTANGDGYDSLNLKQLRKQAKKAGIRPGKMSKAALLVALREVQP